MYLYDSNSLAFFIELDMFQRKAVEKTTTKILHSKTLFLIVPFMRQKYGRARQATDNKAIHFTCGIPKTTDTYSQYAILHAFPQQQWLCECASMLPYMYTANFVQTLDHKKHDFSHQPLGTLVWVSLTSNGCLIKQHFPVFMLCTVPMTD